MFEVFIDENKSGGYHVFDGTANNEASLGLNAENAFAYHIFTAFPPPVQTQKHSVQRIWVAPIGHMSKMKYIMIISRISFCVRMEILTHGNFH
jgi:hypothetical protein